MREEEKEVGLRIGREMVEADLRAQGWSLEQVEAEGRTQHALTQHGVKSSTTCSLM